MVLHQNTYLILYLHQMTAVAVQELSQSWKLLSSTAERQASVAFSFPTVLKIFSTVK